VTASEAAETRRACPICGAAGRLAYECNIDEQLVNEFTYASRKIPELMHYEYLECETCKLLFTSELPDESSLISAYEDAAFDAAKESAMAAATYVRALQVVLRRGVSSVLDVGCGDGEFMSACLAAGVTSVHGIEPSPAASCLAPASLQSRIYSGGYETYKNDDRVDLVTLFQTIEHIRNPIGFLVDAQSFARPGGYIAVACHDYTALPNRLMGEKSPIFDIEHLQVFSQRSITKAMQKAGLHVGYVRAYSNSYPLAYWGRLAPLPSSLKSGALLDNALTNHLNIRLPVGNIMAIGQIPD